MKKIIAAILIVLMAAPVAVMGACGKDSLKKSVNITVDGVINESAYDAISPLVTGIKGMVTVKTAASKQGLYFGISVADEDMKYYTEIETGDYIGLAIDTKAERGADSAKSESTVLFRFDVSGRYAFSRGDEYAAWQLESSGEAFELSAEGLPKYKLVVDGTAVEVGSSTQPIGNVGYAAEFFFSWELLNTTASNIAKRDHTVFFNIEHRDYGTDVCSTANVDAPSLYNSVRYVGKRKGINMPSASPEITIDGKMDESAWNSATVTNQGNFAELFEDETAGDFIAKAFFGKNGLYIGIFAEEPNLQSYEATGSAYKNCGSEIRIYVYDKDDTPLASFKWLFDLFGPQWHETGGGGINSSFAIYAQYAYNIVGTINDDTDTDTSWGFEMFVPYEQLGITAPSTDYVKILNAVGSATQNNALPAEYTQKNSDDWTVIADYIKVSKS